MTNEQMIFVVNQGWKEINPVQCGWQECVPSHHFGPATRTHYLLHYVVSGQGRFTLHGHTYSVEAGQIFVIRPYEMTYYEADRSLPWKYIWIGFECAIPLPSALQEDVLTLPQAGPIFSAIRDSERISAGREALLCGKIWELFALLFAGSTPPDQAGDYVERARTYMEAEYMRGISISELAKRLCLDRSYFSSLFRRKTGKSPQQYLTDYRLERAAELMTGYGYAPGEAAASTGYADIFSFSRMFKRRYGVSPSQYTAQGREKDKQS